MTLLILASVAIAALLVLGVNEITFNYSLTVQNPSSPATGTVPFKDAASNNLSLTQNAIGESAGVMTVPTTAGGTALPLSGVTTNGVIWIKNLDTTNYMQLGIVVSATFYPVHRVKPGEEWPWRLDPACTPYVLAHTSAVQIQYKLFQD